ncbi:methyltransferase, FkbM family [compost metagenome]
MKPYNLPLLRLILRRKPFRGQFRLFSWLFQRNMLPVLQTIDQPLLGNFKLHLNTKYYIDSCIYYTGDYENALKIQYQKYIKRGFYILDVGANIGFHSLFFAELTGKEGKVIAIEPIDVNYEALVKNTRINTFPQLITHPIALGNENKILDIHIDTEEQNPGAFNLFEEGEKNYKVVCKKGDDLLKREHIDKIDFIKIDVEGYEVEVINGLANTIAKYRPIINFEYNSIYQLRGHHQKDEIFLFLKELNYSFLAIDKRGRAHLIEYNNDLIGAEVIAIP